MFDNVLHMLNTIVKNQNKIETDEEHVKMLIEELEVYKKMGRKVIV